LRLGTPAIVGEAPLTVLISPMDGGAGPDSALLLALNPTDEPTLLGLPDEDPPGWTVYLDSAARGVAEGKPLPGLTFEMSGRSVLLLGRPTPASP
jgi:hypothetical protein